jgi:S-phase kinase-associated protein 1
MSDIPAGKVIRLQSADDQEFSVTGQIASMSVTIKNMLDDLGWDDDDAIPLPSVDGAILEKVIAYCEAHKDDPPPKQSTSSAPTVEPSDFDTELLNDIDQGTLFKLILAANFLDIKSLLDLTCYHVAQMIKNKTPEEIRSHFNIKNDFTPQEEEQVRKENEWVEDKA